MYYLLLFKAYVHLIILILLNTQDVKNYELLGEHTNGLVICCNDDDFKNELFSIADMISEETNNGYWIALDDLPMQYGRLREEPVKNGTCDTDGDTLYFDVVCSMNKRKYTFEFIDGDIVEYKYKGEGGGWTNKG